MRVSSNRPDPNVPRWYIWPAADQAVGLPVFNILWVDNFSAWLHNAWRAGRFYLADPFIEIIGAGIERALVTVAWTPCEGLLRGPGSTGSPIPIEVFVTMSVKNGKARFKETQRVKN